jgi:glycopeptide antibiotics resistance protein
MKNRIVYFVTTLVVLVIGLLSRKFMWIFPKPIAPFIGDMLWAMMVYFGFRFLFPKLDILKSLLLAILFSFSIEISQLYQANWINNIRATTLGGLVLGHGFLFEDLISYSIGIILGCFIDKSIKNR